MRALAEIVVLAAALGAASAAPQAAGATESAAEAGATATDQVVVRVGSVTMPRSQIEARLRRMVPFQRRTFGRTPEQVRQGYLERAIVPELLITAEARARGIPELPYQRLLANRILATALDDQLRNEADAALSEAEIRKYFESSSRPGEVYEQNKDSYRIVLRRRKAKAMLSSIEARGKKRVRLVAPELVDSLELTPQGKLGWAPGPSPARKDSGDP